MVEKIESLDNEIKSLEDIVYLFHRSVVAYSDTMQRIDCALIECEDCEDIDKETIDYYVAKTDEVIKNMPPAGELMEYVIKYCNTSESDTFDNSEYASDN